jgi:RNA polymerase sigma-70 factor
VTDVSTPAFQTKAGRVAETARMDADDVARVLAGDQAAFTALLNRYHRTVVRYAAARGFDPSSAEDLAQKTFITAYDSLADYDTRRPLLDWLRGIAMNHCRNEWRRRARQARMEKQLIEIRRAEWEAAALPNRDDDARLEALNECLAALGDRERELIRLRFVEGRSLKDIGRQIGRTEVAARLWLLRLRGRLLECIRLRLGEEGGIG